jgi:hydroxyacylglutathione hydrolase
MLIERFVVGPIQTNCYLVACEETKEAMVIDPDVREKTEKNTLLDSVKQGNLQLQYIVNTHHHSDHTAGNTVFKQATGAKILVHEIDAVVLHEPWKWWLEMMKTHPQRPCPVCGNIGNYLDLFKEQGKAILNCRVCGFQFEILSSPPADRLLHHGDVIKVGMVDFVVIHTPGHSPGSISLYAEEEKVVFTGDTLFNRSIGRTDMFDASFDEIIRSVKELTKLPDDTVVYPGHGEKTTIGEEKHENPYVQM